MWHLTERVKIAERLQNNVRKNFEIMELHLIRNYSQDLSEYFYCWYEKVYFIFENLRWSKISWHLCTYHMRFITVTTWFEAVCLKTLNSHHFSKGNFIFCVNTMLYIYISIHFRNRWAMFYCPVTLKFFVYFQNQSLELRTNKNIIHLYYCMIIYINKKQICISLWW